MAVGRNRNQVNRGLRLHPRPKSRIGPRHPCGRHQPKLREKAPTAAGLRRGKRWLVAHGHPATARRAGLGMALPHRVSEGEDGGAW